MEKIWSQISGFLTNFHTQMESLTSVQLITVALVIIVIVGLAGGCLAKKLKQPLLLGYILAGVLVSFAFNAGFGASANDALETLANIGVALLLFSMGLEFEKKDLASIYKVAVWGSLSQVIFTLAAGAGIAWGISYFYPEMFHGSVTGMILFGTAFVSTSTAVILKTLTSRGLMDKLSSKVMIGMSIVQDLTVIPLFIIISQSGSLFAPDGGILAALRPLILGAVYMALILTIGAKYIPCLLKAVAATNSKELFLLAVVGVALGTGYIADCMEVSFSFGAFLAGIALSDSEFGKKAIYEMMPVRDLFAMLFFVSIGMMLDIAYLFDNIGLVVTVMLATSLSRTIFLALVTYFSGFRNIIPIAMLFGMVPTSEIAFIVIQLGRTNGFFNDNVYSLILAAVVLSMITGPLIDALTAPVYALLRRTILKNQQISNTFINVPEDLDQHVIIAASGNISRFSAYTMKRINRPYILLEPVFQEYEKTLSKNLPVIFGAPREAVILEAAKINNASMILVTLGDFEKNLAVIEQAQKIRPDIPVITCANTEEELEKLKIDNSVFDIVQPQWEAVQEMMRHVMIRLKVSPSELTAGHADAAATDKTVARLMRSFSRFFELHWVRIPQECPLAGHTIADAKIRKTTGISVVGVLRDHKIETNPQPDMVLQAGDVLAVIGSKAQYNSFEHLCKQAAAGDPV